MFGYVASPIMDPSGISPRENGHDEKPPSAEGSLPPHSTCRADVQSFRKRGLGMFLAPIAGREEPATTEIVAAYEKSLCELPPAREFDYPCVYDGMRLQSRLEFEGEQRSNGAVFKVSVELKVHYTMILRYLSTI